MISIHNCLAGLGVILVAAGTARADFIVNGGFEPYAAPQLAPAGGSLSTPDGAWTFTENAGVDSGTPGNPGKAVRLESNGLATRDPTIAQTVSGLTVGATYTLTWDLALRFNISGSGTGRSFGVFLDSQSFPNALFFGERLLSTYATQSTSFVATSASHTLIFAGELDNRTNGGVGNTDVSYRIDNISLNAAVTAVPEPTSLALLGLASIGGIGLRLRRRAKDTPAVA